MINRVSFQPMFTGKYKAPKLTKFEQEILDSYRSYDHLTKEKLEKELKVFKSIPTKDRGLYEKTQIKVLKARIAELEK